MKKFLSVIMAVAVLTAVIPLGTFTASAEELSGSCGTNVTWSYNTSTCTLTISGTGSMNDYYYGSDIPWEQYYNTLETVVINSGVISIGVNAFCGCTGLTEIRISDSVTSIGDNAFSGCAGLTSVTIGNSVTSIGWGAFSGCTGLTSLTIPDSVTSIVSDAFRGCTGLTSVTIGNSVTSIGWGAFSGCTGLTEITIPDSVTSVYGQTFGGCTGLTSVTIGNSVTLIDDYAFYDCAYLRNVTIPVSVTSIGREAFYGCGYLESIYYNGTPKKKEKIEVGYGNENLLDATWHFVDGMHSKYRYKILSDYTAAITKVDASISGNIKTPSLLGGYLITEISDGAFANCTEISSVTIDNSVTYIGPSAFENCIGLMSITIPDSVISIGGSAFRSCTGLTSVTIGNAVSEIGWFVFSGCTKLENITVGKGNHIYRSSGNCLIEIESGSLILGCKNSVIPSDDSVTLIGMSAFEGCVGLSAIKIPNSVTLIDDYAFYECKGLISVELPNSLTSIGRCAFVGCTKLKSITIPKSVYISSGNFLAFESTGLESITVDKGNKYYHSSGNCLIETESKTLILGCKNSVIPTDGSVTSIDDNAFYNCIDLTSITIPNSVTRIGCGAFADCTGLTAITIPDSVFIDMFAFENTGYYNTASNWNNGALYIGNHLIEANNDVLNKNYIIKSGTKTISPHAFYDCSAIESIVIPDSLISIGESAFFGCDRLCDVYYTGSENDIYGIEIENDYWGGNDCLLEATWHYNYVLQCKHFGGIATCNRKAICSQCGEEYGEFNPSNHSGNTDVRGRKGATCTENGYTGDTYCLDCGEKIATGKTISALGHNYNSVVTSPTCTEQGYTTYTCSRCGNNYKDDYVAALGHIGGTATCHNKAICSRCSREYGGFNYTNHTGGTEIRGSKSATCAEMGYTGDTYCIGCGTKIKTGTSVPTIDHKYQWKITRFATENNVGLKEEICSVCGHKSGNTIEMIYTGHITGDINNDGEVDNKDLTRLFQYLSNWDVTVNEAALDVNGDDSVDNKDLTRLFQYLSNWDVEIY